ncbi:MAG: Tim44 domain-containing protein [Alphaproteobacteria bacterium]|nr:Tim44 domain-containing protein [Alphaproteobacteria bacterium]
MNGAMPVDLILFGMVAAFLVLRLISVLGRRTGHERPPQPYQPPGMPPAPRPGEAPRAEEARSLPAPVPAPPPDAFAATAARGLPDANSLAGQGLARIREADPSFDPQRFLQNAQAAFGMIIAGFARGDRDALRALLSPDVFAGFEAAITEREKAGETARTELITVREATITSAQLRDRVAAVTIKLISDQVSWVRDAKGEIVSGSEAVTEVADQWTFARDLNSSDPTWLLVGTESGD